MQDRADMKDETKALPVTAVLEPLTAALKRHGRAVLSAPPGAGKTTLVPLHLLEHGPPGRIILLEPRRLAARAAARRMAALLGEEVGETVGWRMRLDTRISKKTRIEVVTEGVFTRMILDDPELAGVDTVIFDEFHERSLDADFGLALAIDVAAALRDDLKLLVMSATLDGARVAALPGAGAALALWSAQIALNTLWTPVFFGAHRIGLALIVLSALWLAVVAATALHWRLDRASGLLFLPYALWVSYAWALNLAIWRMNPA